MRFAITLTAAFAAAFAAQTTAADTITVGVENIEYFPQYSYKDGEYRGFARAIFDAFAKSKGHTMDYRPLPVSRLFLSFVAGDIDLKYPDNAYWSADIKKGVSVVYSDPVVAYIDGVSVLPANKGKPVDDFKTLGIVRGFTAWDWMKRLDEGKAKLQENNSFTGLLEQTVLGRTDGAYGNVAVVSYLLDNDLKKPGALVFDPALPHTKSDYRLSSIKRPEIVAQFNAWMTTEAATVAAIKAEYKVERGVE